MSRRHRRALGRLLGGSRAKRNDTRLEALEEQNQALRDRLAALEGKHDALPGVSEERKDWFVIVGGKRVELRALPPIEWVRSLEELPGFLFAFATEKLAAPEQRSSVEVTQQIVDVARRWILASAVDPEALQLELLTLPEAEHAVAHIATLNGVTGALRKWFREGLGSPNPPRGGEELRAAPEQLVGGELN